MIQKQLIDRLALALLAGEFGAGDAVSVDVAQDGAGAQGAQLQLSKSPAVAATAN